MSRVAVDFYLREGMHHREALVAVEHDLFVAEALFAERDETVADYAAVVARWLRYIGCRPNEARGYATGLLINLIDSSVLADAIIAEFEGPPEGQFTPASPSD